MAFDITCLRKLKHGVLYAAAKKLGSQAALACYIGISQMTLGDWCNLKACPPTCYEEAKSQGRRGWTSERIDDLERKLFHLTGQTLDELFPITLRGNQELLDAPKHDEVTQRIDLCSLPINAQVSELPSPEDEASKKELGDDLNSALRVLLWREREIIKMRYGLNGEPALTLDECAPIFKITKERVRQLEIRALRKLQGNKLVPLLQHLT